MKKFIAIPLLILYLVAVSGMMVQIHFCGTKMSSWKVNDQKVSCCCEPVTKKGNADVLSIKVKADDCCKDKTITFKIAQDQNRTAGIQMQLQSLQLAAMVPLFQFHKVIDVPARSETQVYQANAPPGRWQNIPLYKLHSRFTYYG